MAQTQDFKCPRCGGKLEFDAATQKMLCPYCDSSFDPADVGVEKPGTPPETADADAKWDHDSKQLDAQEAESLKTYVCRSCGGEIISDENTAATACPFCGNPVVLSGRVSGLLRPDLVLPFKTTKKQAIAEMKKFVKSKRFTPRLFADENHLSEIKGIYVPFWLFDSAVSADVWYDATTVRHWSDSSYNYTETSYYDVFRTGRMRFAQIPVDGSKKMPDDLMDSLEPFFFDDAVDFNTAYLSGFFADKYDVPMAESMPRANERTRNSAREALRKSVSGYATVSPKREEIAIRPGKAQYALLPVWLLNTQYRGETYTFAMNGQTGRFIGNLPVSGGRLAGLFAVVAAAVSAVTFAAGLLTGWF